MFTVSDVARLFDVSKQSGRVWAGEFAQHLSEDANPPEGKTRYFTDEDMEVFALVAQMRQEGASYADIHAALSAGQRGNVETAQAAQNQGQGQDAQPAAAPLVPLSAVQQFTQQIAGQYEKQIAAVVEERDHLRDQLQKEREERLQAEKRATTAETRLQVLTEREGEETTKAGSQGSQDKQRPGLLDRIFGR